MSGEPGIGKSALIDAVTNSVLALHEYENASVGAQPERAAQSERRGGLARSAHLPGNGAAGESEARARPQLPPLFLCGSGSAVETATPFYCFRAVLSALVCAHGEQHINAQLLLSKECGPVMTGEEDDDASVQISRSKRSLATSK